MKKNNTLYPDSRAGIVREMTIVSCYQLYPFNIALVFPEGVSGQAKLQSSPCVDQRYLGKQAFVHTFLELPRKLKENVEVQTKCYL